MVKKNKLIFVLGMHRSGTSAATRLFNMLGAGLGRSLLPADPDINAKGYFEDREVVELNEALLHHFSTTWYDLGEMPDMWWQLPEMEPFKARIRNILEQDYDQTPLAVIKDPRLCVLFPLWLDAVGTDRDIRCALVIRHPHEVAASLQKRDNLDMGYGCYLWMRYVLLAEYYSRDLIRDVVTFDHILADPETVSLTLAENLSLEWPTPLSHSAASVHRDISKELRHHDRKGLLSPADDMLHTTAVDIFEKINGGGSDAHFADLDTIREMLASPEDPLARALKHSLRQTNRSMVVNNGRLTDLGENHGRALAYINQLGEDHGRAMAHINQLENFRTQVMYHRAWPLIEKSVIARQEKPMIDIVIPVYRGFRDTKACLESVLATSSKETSHVVVVDDATPDKRIRDYLTTVGEENPNITLIRNEENQGFIKSVNRGMACHPDRDVILLNSDTIVANDWIERMGDCAYKAPRIGTVIPFSNNATLASFPEYMADNPMPPDMTVEALDKIFRKANTGMDVDIPTGVGFCMYIRRECLNEIGNFDARRFGAGYGEENDFCMRAEQKGWRHKLGADIFVYHKGGVSFNETKQRRIEQAMITMGRLHPGYHLKVQHHIAEDPERPLRVNALLHMVRHSAKQKVVFINHDLGGGTEKHVRELCRLHADRLHPIMLRPTTDGVRLDPGGPLGEVDFSFSLPQEYDPLVLLLKWLDVSHIHIHHMMGFPEIIGSLSKDVGVFHDITLHDYYLINANPSLIDTSARFCEDTDTRDHQCRQAYPIPDDLTPSAWRQAKAALLDQARRIFVPSRYTASMFKAYFPGIEPIVAFHPDWEASAPYPGVSHAKLMADDPLRVLVIGALSREKGADILEVCARAASQQGFSLEFHLAGYAYRELDPVVVQHGAYRDCDLPDIIRRISPHLIWFPATWPETYSYTLSSAMNTGLPIAATDLGAFPERTANRPMTWIMNWKSTPQAWIDLFLSILDELIQGASPAVYAWPDQPVSPAHSFRYGKHYLPQPPPGPICDKAPLPLEFITYHITPPAEEDSGEAPQTLNDKLWELRVKIRTHPISGWVIDRIPYRLRQMLKRQISPMGALLSSVLIQVQGSRSIRK